MCSSTGVHERVAADGQLNSSSCVCAQLYKFHEDRPYPANVIGPILDCHFRDWHESEDLRGFPRWLNCVCFVEAMTALANTNTSWELLTYEAKPSKIGGEHSDYDTCDADLTLTRQTAHRDDEAQSYYPHADRAHEEAEALKTIHQEAEALETTHEEEDVLEPCYEEAWAGNPAHEAAWEMLSRAGYDAFQFGLLVEMTQAAGIEDYRSLYTAFRLIGEVGRQV